MSTQFQPPPTQVQPFIPGPEPGTFQFHPIWIQWFITVAAVITASGGGGGGAIDHEALAGLLGGSTGEHYHTTNTQYTELVGNKAANEVYASPASGGAAAPAFRALVAADMPAGTGSVTSVSVVTANGFAGTVANATSTPAITLTTSVNSALLAGNGTAVSAAALTDGYIYVGNGSNLPVGVAMSSEASLANTGAITLSNAAVIGKVLTGYVSGAGVVAATDTILQAIEKLNGNAAAVSTIPRYYAAVHG